MTLDEFETWFQAHPENCQFGARVSLNETTGLSLPQSYRAFLKRFGSGRMFDCWLMPPASIAEATKFVHGLSYPTEDVDFHHLVAFCSLGYDCCYLCFVGEKVVDFDPFEPSSVETVVAESFGEFLERWIKSKGRCDWLSRSN